VGDDAVLGTGLGAALAGGSLSLAQRGGGPDAPSSDEVETALDAASPPATLGRPAPPVPPPAARTDRLGERRGGM
jgi:hypothetical protein